MLLLMLLLVTKKCLVGNAAGSIAAPDDGG
jgi:hypothetical protein